jgi:hypothetical protein
MPSEKAKENKTLTAQCCACGKAASTELIHGVLIERNGKRSTVPICDDCRTKGWQPPAESS